MISPRRELESRRTSGNLAVNPDVHRDSPYHFSCRGIDAWPFGKTKQLRLSGGQANAFILGVATDVPGPGLNSRAGLATAVSSSNGPCSCPSPPARNPSARSSARRCKLGAARPGRPRRSVGPSSCLHPDAGEGQFH